MTVTARGCMCVPECVSEQRVGVEKPKNVKCLELGPCACMCVCVPGSGGAEMCKQRPCISPRWCLCVQDCF